MKAPSLQLNLASLVLLVVAISTSLRAQTADKTSFALFPINMKCVCVDIHMAVPGMKIMEVGKTQLFLDKKTGHELFQVAIGPWLRSEPRRFGIAAEGDFNHDGLEDIAWYGAADNFFVMYVFLSSPQGYRQINVLKTFAQEWARESGETAPELGDLASDYALDQIKLERTGAALALTGHISSTAVARTHIHPRILRVESANFVYEPPPHAANVAP
jgi:hypothetical protein